MMSMSPTKGDSVKISELIKTLSAALEDWGDIPVAVPTLGDTDTADEPMDVCVLDGNNDDPDYSQPTRRPRGHYFFIGGQ